ncbi:MAG TPA: diguanylate cyclase [Humidesulfovibrio sp.]|uniref:diguanylate cyclase n=1 Tax=Humidesulfovibrio sp. TaxID=2910988 RepID=UPI002B890A8B|nr:diguanylate cyclase [Humidesulfovibrio sp.]HWR02911.1 diguanylate cyclase [Humidesulfovibrio sp.]
MDATRVDTIPEIRDLLERAGLKDEDLPQGFLEGGQGYAEALYLLTRMRFSAEDALLFWGEILRHHQGLNLALGRDVGIRVAVCDYFMNLHPKMRDPVIVEVQVLLQKEKSALLDELTGLYNRRYFNDAIGREVERFKRFGQRFSLVMLDVDHFKRFNDTYGHTAGDDALRTVSSVLQNTARSFDHVVRYGGEEFALILPHTDADQAVAAAERMRCAIAANPVKVGNQDVPITVSLGAATFPEDAINARDLVCRADEALYEAKRTRNTACSFSERNRRFPRAPINLVVLFTSQNGEPVSQPIRVTAMNVSFGGMLCLSPAPILPGTKVEVALDAEAPNQRGLRVSARVVRLERESEDGGFGIALAFNLGTQEERRDLVRLVELNENRAI